jgi:ubiquinone/menaquinone biosynthesis C-methylase UbiE
MKLLPSINDFSLNFSLERPESSKNIFVKDNGLIINLIPNYRWLIKKGWLDFRGLFLLDFLQSRGKLTSTQSEFLKTSINEFTITRSEDEINQFVAEVIAIEHKDLFFFDQNEQIYIQPCKENIQPLINHYFGIYKSFASKCLELKEVFQSGKKVLEIGYESGGFSILALEKFGLDVYGIDNGYSGIKNVSSYPLEIAKLSNSNANFIVGDISKKTEFDNNQFDLVSSEAVLEHIMDLIDAFHEMHRILKPGGLMFHSYDPYFHPGGGHALGILDRPWMHLELDRKEYERFMKEKRPFEAERAINWYEYGLNKSFPQSAMMQAIIDAGFELIFWESNKINYSLVKDIKKETINSALKNYKNLTIDDFIAQKHTFVARKI